MIGDITNFQLGNRLFAQRKYNESIEAFEKHLAIFPEEAAKTYERIAACFFAIQNNTSAETYYRKALELNPNHFRALSGLAGILPEKSEERLSLLKRAVSIQPSYLLFLEIGDFYRSVRKDYIRAQKAYEKAWERDPRDKSAYQKLWSLFSIMGNKEESQLWSKRWKERDS